MLVCEIEEVLFIYCYFFMQFIELQFVTFAFFSPTKTVQPLIYYLCFLAKF